VNVRLTPLTFRLFSLFRGAAGWHGKYPGIGKFTGLSFGEHQLADVEARVKRIIDVDSMPVEPFSHDLKTLYEPLRKTFMVDHARECNVLFRLRVRKQAIEEGSRLFTPAEDARI
jgi:hypothetical protein